MKNLGTPTAYVMQLQFAAQSTNTPRGHILGGEPEKIFGSSKFSACRSRRAFSRFFATIASWLLLASWRCYLASMQESSPCGGGGSVTEANGLGDV